MAKQAHNLVCFPRESVGSRKYIFVATRYHCIIVSACLTSYNEAALYAPSLQILLRLVSLLGALEFSITLLKLILLCARFTRPPLTPSDDAAPSPVLHPQNLMGLSSNLAAVSIVKAVVAESVHCIFDPLHA